MGLLLLRYGELALKGQNRRLFVRRLRRNIRDCLRTHNLEGTVRSVGQRIYVETDDAHAAAEPLGRVFGLVSVSPVESAPLNLDQITKQAIEQAEEAGLTRDRSFRVQTRRANKSFPLNSPQVNQHVGAAIVERFGAPVDLSREADITVGIEITDREALIYSRVIPAPGGLPLGTQGRVVVLISGGIDSPVAAWLMMKRGCTVIPVHFRQNDVEASKAMDNLDQLARYSYGWTLRPIILDHHEVIGPVLDRLDELGESLWSCVFCKRALVQRAAEIADQHRAHAVVMGDSLGQVASQTLPNMEAISYGMPKPILRPLIGMDKNDIIMLARDIGTFDISIRDSSPCPFLPDHPITQASIERLEQLISEIENDGA